MSAENIEPNKTDSRPMHIRSFERLVRSIIDRSKLDDEVYVTELLAYARLVSNLSRIPCYGITPQDAINVQQKLQAEKNKSSPNCTDVSIHESAKA